VLRLVTDLAANPNNKGSYGTSAAGDENTEYGAGAGFANDHLRAQIGYMSRSILKSDQSGLGNRSLADLTAGCTFGGFSLDAEYSVLTDPNKNTLTPADATDLESSGSGVLALATYKFNEAWSFGIRYEDVENDPAGLSLKSANESTASLHYRVSPEFEMRSEFGNYNFSNVTGLKWNESRFNIAALITF